MAEEKGISWLTVTADTLVSTKPVWFYGAIILTSVTGGDATIYNGHDAAAGRKWARLEGIANESRPVIFPKPFLFDRGLYIDVGSDVTEVTVGFEPLES